MKNRVLGLDLAKVFAMWLVVLLHFSFYSGSFFNNAFTRSFMSLCVCCVPLFICVNGALLLSRSFNLLKHVRRLVNCAVLIFFWRAFHILTYRLLGAPRVSLTQVLNLLLGGSEDGYLMGHFWFLNALFCLYCLFPLLKMAWDINRTYLLPLITILCLLFPVKDGLLTCVLVLFPKYYASCSAFDCLLALNPLSNYGYLLLYFLAGGYLFSIYEQAVEYFTRKSFNMTAVLVSIAFISWMATAFIHQVQFEHGSSAFGVDFGYWLPSSVALTASLFLAFLLVGESIAAKQGPTSKVVSIFGAQTFKVYMLHMPVILMYANIEFDYFHLTGFSLFPLQVFVASVIYLCLLLIGCLIGKSKVANLLFKI